MKIGICGDIHYCINSSLITGKGEVYSKRIENCIKSINWFEDFTKDCDLNIYLGDFFDKSSLCAEELTSIKTIKWNKIPKYFLVGNHEMGQADLTTNSVNALGTIGNVIDAPCLLDGCSIGFLPYILNIDRKPLKDYFGGSKLPKYIFSHNDLKGIQMGSFESKEGFDISEVTPECKMFFNGHIHNGSKISDNILNVGNLTGQNFSEDAFKYQHRIYILDTDTGEIEDYINPFAYNFIKAKIDNLDELDLSIIDNIVISVTCSDNNLVALKNQIDNCPKIVASRINVISEINSPTEVELLKKDLQVDHIKQFVDYMIEHIGNTDIVKTELEEIIK